MNLRMRLRMRLCRFDIFAIPERRGWIALAPLLALLAAGCSPSPDAIENWPGQPPAEFKISERKIEALIQCYKIVVMVQDRNSGAGRNTEGIATRLSTAKNMIEDRLIGDLTDGAEKMRLNEKIDMQLQGLLRDKPYGSEEILRDAAGYCAGLEARDAWREMLR